MKTVEITEASLAEYGRKTAKETWVLTSWEARGGRGADPSRSGLRDLLLEP